MTNGRPVVLVTGASSGVGRACANRFADTHDLVLVGRRAERLETAAKELGQRGARCVPLPMDVTEPGTAHEAIDRALSEFSRVDVVVAAAGHGQGGGPITKAMDESRLTSIVATNLSAIIDLFAAALPALRLTDGVFVAIGSIAGKVASPGYSVYAATKHGLTGFMDSVRGELRGTMVRACLVQCGSINTEFASVLEEAPQPYVHDLAEWPFRPLVPEEVADAVHWIVAAPAHVEISEVVIRGTGDRNSAR